MTPREKIETLEEAAEKILSKEGIKLHPNGLETYLKGNAINAMVEMAKWQAKRMYSEEEAGKLIYNIIGKYGKHYDIMFDGAKLNELFEEFKKK